MKSKVGVTIGNFDGVHRGHRALVEAVNHWKRMSGAPARSVVITFVPHPAEVLKPGVIVPRLTSTDQKTSLLYNLGIDEVRALRFTPEFAKTPAREFFESVLLRDLDLGFLAIGDNFFFGHNREGTPQKIIEWCAAKGVEARIVSPVESDGESISSTRIRTLIQEGKMVAASRLLGRDYSITGVVSHGDKRGRLLGFPTANLLPTIDVPGSPCLPARGVYLSSSTIEGRTFPSVTNVGVKPTVTNAGQVTVETHLLDFSGDLYGKLLTVEFRDRLREERKFSGLEELTKQIQADIQIARSRIVGQ